jgi:hypothetical protein
MNAWQVSWSFLELHFDRQACGAAKRRKLGGNRAQVLQKPEKNPPGCFKTEVSKPQGGRLV